MSTAFQFNPNTHQLCGPVGTLPVPADDQLAHRFLMLVEGECLEKNILSVAQKHGYCRQRYYQLLESFKKGGLPALQPRKTGPKSNYRRTDQAIRQVLRYRFLDPDCSPEVITQKLRQTGFHMSQRSVQRILADYGLQKKTLRTQPQKSASAPAYPGRQKKRPPQTGRRSNRRTGGPPTTGR